MQNLFSRENLVDNAIGEGDAGVILRANGEFHVFSTGEVDPLNLTDRQIEQGRQLMAIVTMLNLPQVMDVVLKIAADPDIAGRPGIGGDLN